MLGLIRTLRGFVSFNGRGFWLKREYGSHLGLYSLWWIAFVLSSSYSGKARHCCRRRSSISAGLGLSLNALGWKEDVTHERRRVEGKEFSLAADKGVALCRKATPAEDGACSSAIFVGHGAKPTKKQRKEVIGARAHVVIGPKATCYVRSKALDCGIEMLEEGGSKDGGVVGLGLMDFEVLLDPMKDSELSEVGPLSVSSLGRPTVFQPSFKFDVGKPKEVESRPEEAQLSISSLKLLKNPPEARALKLVEVGGTGALELEQEFSFVEGFDVREKNESKFHSNPVFSCIGDVGASSSSTLSADARAIVVSGLQSDEEGEDVAPLQMVRADDCLGIEGLALAPIEDS